MSCKETAVGCITDTGNVLVGHVTDLKKATGCTVVLCQGGGVCGVDVRGGASGTFGTDTASPFHLVPKTFAVVLTGGSAFGLESVFGVMQWLEERGIGFDVGVTKVPIVSAAVVFDLRLGNPKVRPTKSWGYKACEAATSEPSPQGNVGAGTGATVGKLFGIEHAMKGGLGRASVKLKGGVLVGALVVVNSWGDVFDYETGKLLAGVRNPKTRTLANAPKLLESGAMPLGFKEKARKDKALARKPTRSSSLRRENTVGINTTIGVVVTNARLEKWEATKLAQLAQNGIAWAVRPAHTMLDGDTVFTLSVGRKQADLNALGAAAARAVAEAIRNAVLHAEELDGIPAVKSIRDW